MIEEENLENNYSEKEIDKKEQLYERFARERIEWYEKIDEMTRKLRDIYQVSEVLVDVLSARQKLLDYQHTIFGNLSKVNANLRDAKRKKFIHYTTESDLRLDKEKNLFIETDLKKQILLQELLDSHLKFIRETIETCDRIHYSVKWKIQLEEYRRSNN